MQWKWRIGSGLLAALVAGAAFAADRPVIDVSPSGLAPDKIEVHAGESIRWRAAEVRICT